MLRHGNLRSDRIREAAVRQCSSIVKHLREIDVASLSKTYETIITTPLTEDEMYEAHGRTVYSSGIPEFAWAIESFYGGYHRNLIIEYRGELTPVPVAVGLVALFLEQGETNPVVVQELGAFHVYEPAATDDVSMFMRYCLAFCDLNLS